MAQSYIPFLLNELTHPTNIGYILRGFDRIFPTSMIQKRVLLPVERFLALTRLGHKIDIQNHDFDKWLDGLTMQQEIIIPKKFTRHDITCSISTYDCNTIDFNVSVKNGFIYYQIALPKFTQEFFNNGIVNILLHYFIISQTNFQWKENTQLNTQNKLLQNISIHQINNSLSPNDIHSGINGYGNEFGRFATISLRRLKVFPIWQREHYGANNQWLWVYWCRLLILIGNRWVELIQKQLNMNNWIPFDEMEIPYSNIYEKN